jgi:hypothetical protein
VSTKNSAASIGEASFTLAINDSEEESGRGNACRDESHSRAGGDPVEASEDFGLCGASADRHPGSFEHEQQRWRDRENHVVDECCRGS